MRRTLDEEPSQTDEVILRAIEEDDTERLIVYFRGAPHTLMQRYVALWENRQTVPHLFEFLDDNPIIAFRLLQYAFPDVLNRLWHSYDATDERQDEGQALEAAHDALVEPYVAFERSFIASDLLVACTRDEKHARKTGQYFSALYPSRLPHARYCFLSSLLICDFLNEARRLGLVGDEFELLHQEFITRSDPPQQSTTLEDVRHLLELVAGEEDGVVKHYEIDGVGPLAYRLEGDAERTLWKAEEPTRWLNSTLSFGEDVRFPAEVVTANWFTAEEAVVEVAEREHSLYVSPQWRLAMLSSLRARLSAGCDGDEQRMRTLLADLDESIDAVARSDPALADYLDGNLMDLLYGEFFPDRRHWWRVLFSKLQLVERSQVAAQRQNRQRIYQSINDIY